MQAGEVLCFDETMIKAFHKGINGKMKIVRKLRLIGNELKTVSNTNTHIVLHMELHKVKEEVMSRSLVQQLLAPSVLMII